MDNAERIAESREALASITPGAWSVGNEIDGIRAGRATVVTAAVGGTTRRVVTVDQTRPHWDSNIRGHAVAAESNVAFIAAAPARIKALTDALEAADAKNKRAQQALSRIRSFVVIEAATDGIAGPRAWRELLELIHHSSRST
ncbi:hypothetical protein [Mycolicibacterium sp.]|uniref:hypothetical protein n=1 Tax=Mycolicibacterium sp. TaxID=2320850 RepID=UPI00355E44A7